MLSWAVVAFFLKKRKKNSNINKKNSVAFLWPGFLSSLDIRKWRWSRLRIKP
jgi:hypothetical protein